MRALLPAVAALLALAFLAGCVGSGGGGNGNVGPTSSGPGPSPSPALPVPPPPGPTVVDLLNDFGLDGCRGLTIEHRRSLSEVQALLPPGFTAKVVEGTQAAGLAEGFGSVLIDAFACGNLTVADQPRVTATYYGQLYAFIEPPAERVPGTPDVPIHEYLFRTLAAEDVLAALWPAAGYDSRSGPASMTIGGPAGLPLPQRGANATIAAYTASGTGNDLDDVPIAAPFARYTALNDGSVLVWTGTYSFPGAYGGFGSFDVAPDDVFAPFGDNLAGNGYFYEGGSMDSMDLRRVFTPP